MPAEAFAMEETHLIGDIGFDVTITNNESLVRVFFKNKMRGFNVHMNVAFIAFFLDSNIQSFLFLTSFKAQLSRVYL